MYADVLIGPYSRVLGFGDRFILLTSIELRSSGFEGSLEDRDDGGIVPRWYHVALARS